MLELLFAIGMLWIFGKLLFIGISAAWSISKIFMTIVLLPLVLIILVIAGLMYMALIILAVIEVILLLTTR